MVHIGLLTGAGKDLLKDIIEGLQIGVNIYTQKYGTQHMQEIGFLKNVNINYANLEYYDRCLLNIVKEHIKNKGNQIIIEVRKKKFKSEGNNGHIAAVFVNAKEAKEVDKVLNSVEVL